MSLLDSRERHGYEIAKLIVQRSQGELRYGSAALYPILYKLERRGLIDGRWVEKPGERRRRFYRLTAAGRRELRALKADWRRFLDALVRVAELAP